MRDYINMQGGFLTSLPSDQRLEGERDVRRANGIEMRFGHPYLDDALVGIANSDLVLVGADTGAGKTDFCCNIAITNLMLGKRVSYIALEAHEREIEQRILYRTISNCCTKIGHAVPRYTEWMNGDKVNLPNGLYEQALEYVTNNLENFSVFYRASSFGTGELKKVIGNDADSTDLFIIDHIHYVDIEDENENRGLKELTKTIRDLAIIERKPVIFVAHLRKRNATKKSAPTIDDFYGSSDISKIATRCIMLSPAHSVSSDDINTSPTIIQIVKDRLEGSKPYHALSMYLRSSREYMPTYTLGFESPNGEEWNQIDPARKPGWARRHKTI